MRLLMTRHAQLRRIFDIFFRKHSVRVLNSTQILWRIKYLQLYREKKTAEKLFIGVAEKGNNILKNNKNLRKKFKAKCVIK
jgi:hypothetical protein